MKLNDKALEAATQARWRRIGCSGSFRENAGDPNSWVEATAAHVAAYLDALDSEGLADLYEYWCERIEALPVPDEIHRGDLVAYSSIGAWYAVPATGDYAGDASYGRVLRRARRQWKIGDLVDDTRDLPDGAVVRDRAGDIAEHDGSGNFCIAGVAGALDFDYLLDPRIIWLPENGDES